MFEVQQDTSEIWPDEEEATEDDDDSSGEESSSSNGSESVSRLDEVAIEENPAELEIEGDFECVCSV